MKYIKWSLIALVVLTVGGFLHYTLPRHDIVRIVGVEIQRIQTSGSIFFAGSESANSDGSRDVKIINAIRENDRPMVYRNEDTGWGWPPYFKLNSSDLQARAADLTSTSAEPQWVSVKRYGWRSQFLSIYPNAVRMNPVAGPGVAIVPWFNIVFLTGLAVVLVALWRVWVRFRQRRIEPLLDDIGDAIGFGDDDEPTGAGPKAPPSPRPSRGPLQRVRDMVMGRSGR